MENYTKEKNISEEHFFFSVYTCNEGRGGQWNGERGDVNLVVRVGWEVWIPAYCLPPSLPLLLNFFPSLPFFLSLLFSLSFLLLSFFLGLSRTMDLAYKRSLRACCPWRAGWWRDCLKTYNWGWAVKVLASWTIFGSLD